MNLVIAAGGTGGHIIPALAVAKAWREKGYPVVWFGRADGLEAKIAKNNQIDFVKIKAFGLSDLRRIQGLSKVSKSVNSAIEGLKEVKASCVLSTGSYASFPTAIASSLIEIPLVIHEQNTLMGLANKVLLPFANKIYLGLPIDGLPKSWLVGNPILFEPKVSQGDSLLIFAGSQGSQFLNNALPQILKDIKCGMPIIHIAGAEKKWVEKTYQDLGIVAEVYDFIQDMDKVYQKTKLVVCRAGAMSLSEVLAYKIPAIIIPYPYAKGNHQRKNAKYMVSLNGAVMVEENTNELKSILKEVMYSSKWQAMKAALNQQHYHNATDIIVKGITDICAQSLPH